MLGWLNRFIKNEQGTIIVLFAGVLTLLLFFTAFVVDFGFLYFHKRNLQNAADAAALSGVWNIANAEDEAKKYAEKHNVTYGVEVDADNQRVHVIIENHYPRYFGIVFGREDYKVVAEAIAGTVTGWDKFMPFTPLPKNYIDDVECPIGTESTGPFLDEYNYGYLHGRGLDDLATGTSHTYVNSEGEETVYTYDPYGAGKEKERLDDFKKLVNLPVKLGVISGTEESEARNFGWLTLPGIDRPAKPRTLARLIIEGYQSDDPEGEIEIESRPGAINSLFTGNEHNITGENISAIEFLLQYNQPFYVILPHPSIPFDDTFTTIERNNYLIGRAEVPFENYGCGMNNNPSGPYSLIAVIDEVYNPLCDEDLEKLQRDGVRVTIPFLIR